MEYKSEKVDTYGFEVLGPVWQLCKRRARPGSDIDVCIKLNNPDFFNMTGIQEKQDGILKSNDVSLFSQAVAKTASGKCGCLTHQ